MSSRDSSGSVEDEWVDQLVPETLDWRELVREYPLAAVGTVAFVGYIVGRYQGDRLMEVAKETVKRQLDDSLSRYVGFAGKESARAKNSER